MTSNISTAFIIVTPIIGDGTSEGMQYPSIKREIGADLAACDIGGVIGECVSALAHVGINPDEVEFKVKIVPGYVPPLAEAA